MSLNATAARGGAAAILRARIDEMLDASLPAIVLGDFNAEPISEEIFHERCFFARGRLHNTPARLEKATGSRHRPFFVKQPEEPTYYYGTEECWKTLDFLLVSGELKDRVISVERLTSLLGKNLVCAGAKGLPDSVFSDHFPVHASVHFQ